MPKTKWKVEYKWVIFAVSMLMVLTSLGFCSSSKDIYLRAIANALEIERWKFSFNDVSRYLTTAILNLFFGAMVAKFGAKKLILAGMGSLTVSCLIYATANQVGSSMWAAVSWGSAWPGAPPARRAMWWAVIGNRPLHKKTEKRGKGVPHCAALP